MEYAKTVHRGSAVNLAGIDPDFDAGLDKVQGEALAEKLGARLQELQELQFASADTPFLIVLQGRDTAGKDGTIRFLLKFLNAQSTRVASFKVPTPKELAHDYLWRVHQETPGKGETVIFNRSHYEDVLVVRVHSFVPEAVWSKRYEHINDFERLLTDSGCNIAKFFLHISKEEQEERLRAREQDVTKSWKLNVGDWKEREHWDAYTEAYEDALSKCSTDYAPWHVIPANKKWFRNLAVAEVLVKLFEHHEKAWMRDLEETGIKAKAELAAFRTTLTQH